ncbi:hypothetical protein PoB_007605200 [Plakobranchus ocellatus]|uniref:Uncharacterized protein n=1 Tax=Plakobranchus ocellatus TaxID=259542 RepID=A0AAV4DYX2_9GAST|nr:hypothetical protein PoB_007605200 [Plakobranchus ocellatus]
MNCTLLGTRQKSGTSYHFPSLLRGRKRSFMLWQVNKTRKCASEGPVEISAGDNFVVLIRHLLAVTKLQKVCQMTADVATICADCEPSCEAAAKPSEESCQSEKRSCTSKRKIVGLLESSQIVASVYHDKSGDLMVTIIREACQLYLAENPEKFIPHKCGQEMSERWAVLQQKGADICMRTLEDIRNKGHGISMSAFCAEISEDEDKLADK